MRCANARRCRDSKDCNDREWQKVMSSVYLKAGYLLFDQQVLLAPNEKSTMIARRIAQCITIQCQYIQALQHEVQNIWLLNVGQLNQQLVYVLQRLRQRIQCEFELSDRGVPEVLLIFQFLFRFLVAQIFITFGDRFGSD